MFLRFGILWAMLASITGGATACDGLRMTRSCDLREVDDHCQEYGVFGPDMVALQGTCAAVDGVWGDGPCPRADVLGGCEDIDPSNPWDVTKWYYAGLDEDLTSAEDVEAECDEGTERFVPAP